jgi:hypothetical protein
MLGKLVPALEEEAEDEVPSEETEGAVDSEETALPEPSEAFDWLVVPSTEV